MWLWRAERQGEEESSSAFSTVCARPPNGRRLSVDGAVEASFFRLSRKLPFNSTVDSPCGDFLRLAEAAEAVRASERSSVLTHIFLAQPLFHPIVAETHPRVRKLDSTRLLRQSSLKPCFPLRPPRSSCHLRHPIVHVLQNWIEVILCDPRRLLLLAAVVTRRTALLRLGAQIHFQKTSVSVSSAAQNAWTGRLFGGRS